jgi:hypothetical protein
MNRLIMAMGLLIGVANAAHAEDCTSVAPALEVEYHWAPSVVTFNSPQTYGSAGCPRYVVDFWTNLTDSIYLFSGAFGIRDQATCESTEIRFTVWTWIEGIVVNGIRTPGHWSEALMDSSVDGSWHPENPQTPCVLDSPVFDQTEYWSKMRVATGLYRGGQPVRPGPVDIGLFR